MLSARERHRRECGWRASVPVEEQRIPTFGSRGGSADLGFGEDRYGRDPLVSSHLRSRAKSRKRSNSRGNPRRRNNMGAGRGSSRHKVRSRRNNRGQRENGAYDGSRGQPARTSGVSQTIFKELQRKRMGMGKGPIMRSPPRAVSGMTTSPSPDFFDFALSHFHIESVASDKETKHAELEVLKLILIREGYVRHLGDVARQIMDGDRSVIHAAGGTFVIDLLVQTRASSLAVVRAIISWRATLARKVAETAGVRSPITMEAIERLPDKVRSDIGLARSQPFVWSGINYLLKMCHDTDFLADTLPLVQALGVNDQHMIHNPLMMPYTLDACPRPSKQQRYEMDRGVGLGFPDPAPSSPLGETSKSKITSEVDGGANLAAKSQDSEKASGKDENLASEGAKTSPTDNSRGDAKNPASGDDDAGAADEVLKLAWVLLAEERRARRAHRQERRQYEKSNSRRRMRSRSMDREREESEDYYDEDHQSGPQGPPMERQTNSEPHVHPSLQSSPLRKGGSRLNSDGNREAHIEDEMYAAEEISDVNLMRPVLAWHDKARLLMRRWEEELRVR